MAQAATLAGLALVLATLVPAPARAAGKCTCETLRNYQKFVEKKRECYKQAYAQGQSQPFSTVPQQTAFLEDCMGWTRGSAQSLGVPSNAPPEKKKSAHEKCRREYCDWICDEAIDNVHEKYHEWYDFWERALLITVAWRWTQGTADAQMIQENALGEIGAHDAEAWFLRDKIKEAERDGTCSDVRKSVDSVERDRRIEEAYQNANRYILSIGGTQ